MSDKDVDLSDLPQTIPELNSRKSPEHAVTTTPIYISSIDLSAVTALRHIRASGTHTLLAYCADRGILLHDRRSGLQHILSWALLRDILPPIEEK